MPIAAILKSHKYCQSQITGYMGCTTVLHFLPLAMLFFANTFRPDLWLIHSSIQHTTVTLLPEAIGQTYPTYSLWANVVSFNPYPTAFPYGNGMVLHFYQQQESSTTKTVHKVINKGLKTYV